jgi:hypothetical protein
MRRRRRHEQHHEQHHEQERKADSLFFMVYDICKFDREEYTYDR